MNTTWHVVYLNAAQVIAHLARVSGDSVTRCLKAYAEDGVSALCAAQYYCPVIALPPYRDTLKMHN